jgi:hypothetical protein
MDLLQPFSSDGIVEIVHLMFMSYAGKTLAKKNNIDRMQLRQRAERSLRAVHARGMLLLAERSFCTVSDVAWGTIDALSSPCDTNY